MELKYVVTKGPNGAPLWFCVESDATDSYSRNASSGKTTFPVSCHFIQRYFDRPETSGQERCFVDVGANIGLYTMSVASCGIRTVAIEALARNYLLLCAAIAKNGFKASVFPIHAAATDEFDLLRIGGDSAWGYVIPKGSETVPGGSETVPGLPCAELLAMLGVPRPTLVKIDVEGYEGPVIAGMRPLLETGADIDLVVEIFPTQMKNLAALESYGYQPYLISKDKLIRTSSKTFNPPRVVDYFCTRKPLDSSFSGARVCNYNIEIILDLVRVEAACPVEVHRTSIASRLKTAPREIREHPAIGEILAELRKDPNSAVVAAATW